VTSARWQKQELIVSSDPPTLVSVQYEEAAFRLEQLKAHAGNVEEGVVGSIETACAIIFAGFESRSNRERSVAVVDRPRMMSECEARNALFGEEVARVSAVRMRRKLG
jgi:hypothetical protein